MCWLPGPRNADDRTLALAARDATLTVWDGSNETTVSSKEDLETLTLLPPAMMSRGSSRRLVRMVSCGPGAIQMEST